ncbi:hypothetical protein L2D01_01865 [Hyphomonadaceae bacterium ML37]|nr:hypothetical protein L2D01_01865 [Hyphomonadaceae bacterium ML37]
MKLALGIGAAGLLAASAWQVGPERALTIGLEALTPTPEIVQDVRSAIDALIEQFKGPGDVSPQD